MLIYAGIGARKTPPEILTIMEKSAILLAKDGYICQTGAAQGADQTFVRGAKHGITVYNLGNPDTLDAFQRQIQKRGL